MSLLTLVQDAMGRIGQPQPTSVVGSADRQVQQLLALANEAGRELARSYRWQALTAQQTFTTVNTPEQPNAAPLDLDRFVPDSFYNRTTRRPLEGPLSPQDWQALQAVLALNTVYLMYRQRGNTFLISPTPPAGQVIAYEYVSTNWAVSATSTPQARFLADTDTSYLDESLITDSLVWRFLRAKGLSYAEELSTYERNLAMKQARDGSATTLNFSQRPFSLDRVNLPDGGFPAP